MLKYNSLQASKFMMCKENSDHYVTVFLYDENLVIFVNKNFTLSKS